MLYTISLIFIILKSTKCSLVFDTMSQNGAYINKYCQETEYCLEGSHLMCRQYDHNQKMGPRCKDMFQIDYDKENEMISILNDIRGHIATGRMLTLDGKPFPRAYGMMRLKADPELTLFARTMSHSCFRRFQEENCANTDIFTSTAFVYSELKQSAYEKNITGAMNLLREQILANIPAEWFTNSISDVGDLRDEKYKVILQGAVRYVGCAMRLMRTDYEPANYYNGVLCYFANVHWPIHQKPYITDRPNPEQGFTEECGCPMGYKETDNCLCDADEQSLWLRASQYPSTRPKPPPSPEPAISTTAHTCTNSSHRMLYDDPKIVIMPIFSIKHKKKHDKINYTNFLKNLQTEQIANLHANDQHESDVPESLRAITTKRSTIEKSYSKVPSALKTKSEKEITSQSSSDKKLVTLPAILGKLETKKNEEKIIGTNTREKNLVHTNNVDIKNIGKKTGYNKLMYFFNNLEKEKRNEVKKTKKEMVVTKMVKKLTTAMDKHKESLFSEKNTLHQLFDIDHEFTELKNYLKHKSNL